MSKDFVPEISHICCMDEFELIGVNGALPWSIPEELEYFKKITRDSIIIMGKRTYESLGREYLPSRINLVLSISKEESDSENLYFRKDLNSILELAKDLAQKDQKNIFIIGGSSVYKQTFKLITKIYLTVIKTKVPYKLKDESEILSHYDFTSVQDNVRLVSSSLLEVNNFEHPIYTFVFEVKDNGS